MRVIAIKPGYDGLQFRDPGHFEDGRPVVFEMPDGAPGSWFVPVDDEGKPLAVIKQEPKRKGEVPGAGPKKGSQMQLPGANKAAAEAQAKAMADAPGASIA